MQALLVRGLRVLLFLFMILKCYMFPSYLSRRKSNSDRINSSPDSVGKQSYLFPSNVRLFPERCLVHVAERKCLSTLYKTNIVKRAIPR